MKRLIVGFEDGRAVCFPHTVEAAVSWVGGYEFRTWSAFERVGYEEATLRDQFAMAALIGALAYPDEERFDGEHGTLAENYARNAYTFADAMLAARNK